MTDIATGWTECLPLLYQSQETVLAAIKRAWSLFPFPLLGIDTDNGAEFINDLIVTYCEQEHLTFTRGRPRVKNDQCFVEEKNRTIVRQVVGYDRFVGEHALRQLEELYRALRLYVNCFQPSMRIGGETTQRQKDLLLLRSGETAVQRLLLCGDFACRDPQELNEGAQALDPVRLLGNCSACNRHCFTVLPRRIPLFLREQSCRFAPLQWKSAQREEFRRREASPTCREDFLPCTSNRRRENVSWAGVGRRRIRLREHGSRLPPGCRRILSAVVETFSGNYNGSPPDAISRCKSAPCSGECVKSEHSCWKHPRNHGQKK